MNNLLMVSSEAGLPTSRVVWSDLAGMTASLGCAIHCATMPLVIGYLPSLGLTWIADEGFHQWMAVSCVVIALAAFVPGWKCHGLIAPAILGVVGIGLISSAAFVLEPCCEHDASIQKTTMHSSLAAVACDECDACAPGTAAKSESSPSWGKTLRPYVTPFGGFVLIVAHLLNHRFGCRCCSDKQDCQSFMGAS
ncbi:MAG: MerC domain-containing protein [Pirellulaceae bacterium]|nr:MerC domain-containing protein [Pirellulaceae bacterium]